MKNELNIPEDRLNEMREAAQKLADEIGEVDLDELIGNMFKSHYKTVFMVMDNLLTMMEEHPEYRNQYLVDSMSDYLEHLNSCARAPKEAEV